jgi:two-component system, OmpR family, phosphate regulon sensor histidine kinase PhoR
VTPGIRGELLRVVVLTAAALALGALSGGWGWSFAVAIIAWGAFHAMEFRRFVRWARRPLRPPVLRTQLWREPIGRLHRSLREVRRRTRDRVHAQRRMRIINAALPDAALLVNGSGEIEAVNPAAERLLGLTPTDVGRNLTALIRLPQLVELVEDRLPENIIEMSAPTPGSPRLEVRRIVIDESSMLLLVRDVTQLDRLLTMRQDFVANVSHELRTPLTIIIGYLEALQDETLDAETVQRVVAKLASPAQRMKALVDDLLLLTRLESSPPPPYTELEVVNVSRMLRAVVTDARHISGGRHEIDLDGDDDLGLLGVESELHSAFANLVNNAVRYSPNGGEIVVRWFRSPRGPRFEVRDQGVGIPAEHISRITERFYRVDLARDRVRGGTGLGLAIVKHVLKRHETTLAVESSVGEGSLFHCTFPQRRGRSITDGQQPRRSLER